MDTSGAVGEAINNAPARSNRQTGFWRLGGLAGGQILVAKCMDPPAAFVAKRRYPGWFSVRPARPAPSDERRGLRRSGERRQQFLTVVSEFGDTASADFGIKIIGWRYFTPKCVQLRVDDRAFLFGFI